jgi:hypothetical protein
MRSQALALCDCVTPGRAAQRTAGSRLDPHVQTLLVFPHAKPVTTRGLPLC